MGIKNRSVYLSVFMLVVLVFGLVLIRQRTVLVNKATEGSWRNFREWFPVEKLAVTHYFSMDQVAKSNPCSVACLHFKVTESGEDYVKFKMFNSYPPEECHWDLFEWSGGMLKYIQTHDGCGEMIKDTIFDPPINFLVQYWRDSADSPFWVTTGMSTQNVYEDGELVCRGTNTYTNRLMGWVKLIGNYDAFGWQTDQLTEWENWNSQKCGGGRTDWRENWYFGEVPVEDGDSIVSLKRSVGGNLGGVNYPDWDVWSLVWKKKPGEGTTVPTSAPISTPTVAIEYRACDAPCNGTNVLCSGGNTCIWTGTSNRCRNPSCPSTDCICPVSTPVLTSTPGSGNTVGPINTPVVRVGCYDGRTCGAVQTVCELDDVEKWRSTYFEGEFGQIERDNWAGDFNCDGKVTLSDREFWRSFYIESL